MVEISQSKEDYLKAIWEREQSGEPVLRARLAEQLGVSAPAVTAALSRLSQADLVTSGEDGTVRLTPAGREIAQHLVLRHNLVEKLLVEVLGLEWYKAHEEAERIEHVISADVEARLVALFGEGGTCPHGVPVQGDAEVDRRRRGLVRLDEVEVGRSVRVAQIFERDGEFLRFLDGRGITPSAEIEIRDRGYDQVLRIGVGEAEIHLGRAAAERIWVEVLEERPDR